VSIAFLQRFQRAVILMSPLFFLGVAQFAAPRIAVLPPAKYELALVSPYLIAVAGLLLAFHFHRGRPFFALSLLVFAHWLSRTYLTTGIEGLANKSLFNLLLLFIPFNFVMLTVMREKGIFTAAGRVRVVFFGCQACIAAALHSNFSLATIANIFANPLITNILAKTAIPQALVVLLVLELLGILIFAIIRQSPIDSGFFGAAVAFVLASNWVDNPSLLVAFSSAAAAIITVSILQDSYNMAFRDELTGIPARRALNEALHGVGRTYVIAMADVDHFKKFNDTYGHDVGDQVLKLVAKKLAGVGGGGKAYRYGGEEFTILFQGLRAQEALPYLEEARELIANYPMAIRGDSRPQAKHEGKRQRRGTTPSGHTSVTVSIGVAESREKMSPEEVIKAADKALYKAKNAGRNQVLM